MMHICVNFDNNRNNGNINFSNKFANLHALDIEERDKNDSTSIFYIFTLQNDKGINVR